MKSGACVRLLVLALPLAACQQGDSAREPDPGDGAGGNPFFAFVEDRGSFLVFEDLRDSFETTNFLDWNATAQFYGRLEEVFLAVHPDDADFLAVTTHFEGPRRFYRHLGRGIRGIGLEHWPEGVEGLDTYFPPGTYFDGTPEGRIQGLFSMGYWGRYIAGGVIDEQFLAYIMGQEFGHAWGAYPFFQADGGTSGAMLGIEDSHWSLYLSTGRSPMDGLDWRDGGGGVFTATAKNGTGYRYEFSDLDLYLMGLLPAGDVRPWVLVEAPHDCVIDGDALPCPDPSSRPFPFGEIGLPGREIRAEGTRRDITIDDVIAAEGERVPPFGEAPTAYRVAFVLLKTPEQDWTGEQAEAIDRVLSRAVDLWHEATRERGSIVNASSPEP